MSIYHEEVPIEDFDYDELLGVYSYPCPCGDLFEISRQMVEDREEEAACASCSLKVRVLYPRVAKIPAPLVKASAMADTSDESF